MRSTLVLDSSQITEFLICPQSWYLAYHRHLIRRGIQRLGLTRGTLTHGLLQRYYTNVWRELPHSDNIASVTNQLAQLKEEVKLPVEEFNFVYLRFLHYTSHYIRENLKIHSIIKNGIPAPAVELGFSIPIIDTEDFFFVLEGKIDLVASINDIDFYIDHKTQSREYNLYKYNIQMMNYALALNHVLGGSLRRGMYNYIGMQQSEPKNGFYRRQVIYFGPEKLARWKKRLTDIFFKIHSLIDRRSFEQNWASCERKYGFCQFTSLCEEDDPRRKEGLIQIEYEQREPWVPWENEGEKENGIAN